jgi:hypothetical protein
VIEIPDCLPIKPLMKKIETLIKEEETRWVLFERAVEDLDLTKEDLLALEDMERRKEEPRIVADTNILILDLLNSVDADLFNYADLD